jgi:heptosyltransferase-2
MTPDYRNILIVRTDRIGDVILTTPVIAALRTQFPESRITVLVSVYTRELVDGNPNVNEVLAEDRKGVHKGVLGFWHLVKEIKRKHFDLAMIFHTKRRTNLLCFLAGIKHRIGYRDKNFGFLLTQGIKDDRHEGKKHESQYCLDLLSPMGLTVTQPPLLMPIQPEAQKWMERWLKDNHLQSMKLIAVHPGASDLSRCWPIESFAKLIDEMSTISGSRVVVFGSGNMIEMAKSLRTLCTRPFLDLTGQTSVAQIAALLKHCHMLISNDSGPVHMGAAAGIYVIALFLRDQPGINPERWRPLGPKSFVIANKPQEAIRLDSSGHITSGLKDSISVDQVLQKAKDLLQRP